MPGPIEKLILLGNSSFKEAVIPWELAEQLRYDREVAALGDGTRPAVAGAKLTPKSKGKGKGKAKEVDPIAEPSLPSSEEFLEREKSAFALAQTLFVRTEKYYQRAMNLIDETGEGIDNEFYPVTCLNLGECCLRRGDDEAAKSWIRPIVSSLTDITNPILRSHPLDLRQVSRIDIPGRMSGAMVIAAQDLILEPAQVWWPNLMPEQPKKPVTKKSKKGGKKGGKKSGKGKGKGKSWLPRFRN